MITADVISLSCDLYEKQATVYRNRDIAPRAAVLYFHGGGLLYGSREDLPDLHLQILTDAGFSVIAFDYPLAPAAKLPVIFSDVCASIETYLASPALFYATSQTCGMSADAAAAGPYPLPYFLWGRSAGAYLCLLATGKGNLSQPPAGILSWYGYGFLTDHWYCSPSPDYCRLPRVDASCVDQALRDADTNGISASGDLEHHYNLYIYARQNGAWRDLIYEGREKFFFRDYTLRLCDNLSAPVFAVHSMNDPDVPFAECRALCDAFGIARPFIIPGKEHDFDRNPDHPYTERVLKESAAFLTRCLSAAG